MIHIYTDGSATKSRSGWGFVAVLNNEIIYENAGVDSRGGTNQEMELIAVVEACDWAYNSEYIREHDITIWSDSAYVINCYTERWYINWMNNDWRNSRGEPVANILSWKVLLRFFKNPQFIFQKVKGHSGHTFNERADMLAKGESKPNERNDLTTSKKRDTIKIELSEILLKHSMKKASINDTIESIMNLMRREGVNLDE